MSFERLKVSIIFSLFICALSGCSYTEPVKTNKIDNEISTEKATALNHLATLSSDRFAGRKFASQTSLLAQDYLVTTLQKLGVLAFRNQYRHPFKKPGLFKTKQGTNIVAYIPGTHHRQEYIILTAHYDHLGSKQNRVFNGADDNASGTAALLHYAKLLKQHPLKHSVILLFTDGEEVNLLGSKAFISQQKHLLERFKLNVNLDMIAGSKQTKKLRFISRGLEQVMSAEYINYFSQLQVNLKNNSMVRLTSGFINNRAAGLHKQRVNWRMASDHGAFSQAGVPFIYFGVGPHKNYHSEYDDFAHINQDFYLAAIKAIFEQLTYLDTAMSASSTDLKQTSL